MHLIVWFIVVVLAACAYYCHIAAVQLGDAWIGVNMLAYVFGQTWFYGAILVAFANAATAVVGRYILRPSWFSQYLVTMMALFWYALGYFIYAAAYFKFSHPGCF